MAVADYNKTKKLDVQSVSGTPTVGKAQPISIIGEVTPKEFDGFEDGDFTNNPTWTETAANGTATVQSTTVKNGSNALELTTSGAGDEILRHDRGTGSISEGDTYQCWINSSSTSGRLMYGLTDSGDLFGNNTAIMFTNDGNLLFQSRDGTGSALNGGDVTIVPNFSANTWYKVEIEFYDTTNNLCAARVYDTNNELINEVTGLNYTGTTRQYVNLRNDDTASISGYFDDVSYSTTDASSPTVSESDTGTGSIVLDFTNIADEKDLAVYDQNGNLLDYEIEDLDTTSETGVLWCYNSWVRDGSTQAQVVYGSNSANVDRQNVSGTWNNTGQNAIAVHHLEESSGTTTDSTSNNYDSVSTIGTTFGAGGEFDGARSFDGTDDIIEFGDVNWFEGSDFTLSAWVKLDTIPASGSHVGIVTSGYDGTIDPITFFYDNNQLTSGEGFAVESYDGSSRDAVQSGFTATPGTWYFVQVKFDNSASSAEIIVDTVSQASGSIVDETNAKPYYFGGEDIAGSLENHLAGDLDEIKITSDIKPSAWDQAEYDASPKAGQVFFSQQAATTTAVTINAPASQATSQSPNPGVTPGNVNIQAPETNATSETPNPTIFSDQFLSAPVSAGNAASPTPTVTPGNATASMPVTTANAVNPNPKVFKAGIISVPVSQANAVSPNPRVRGGDATVTVPATTANAVSPNPTVFSDQVINARVSAGNAASPTPVLTAGPVNVQVNVSQSNAVTPEPNIIKTLGEGASLNIDINAKQQYRLDIDAENQYSIDVDAK